MTAPPTKRLRGRRCLCRGCGEFFNSLSPFEQHRVGVFGIPGARRCLTVAEMRAKGWLPNAAGFWTTGKRPAIAGATRAISAISRGSYLEAGILSAPARLRVEVSL